MRWKNLTWRVVGRSIARHFFFFFLNSESNMADIGIIMTCANRFLSSFRGRLTFPPAKRYNNNITDHIIKNLCNSVT